MKQYLLLFSFCLLVGVVDHSSASMTVCRGEKDNIDLDYVTLRIEPELRPRFFSAINEFATANDLVTGGSGDAAKGRSVILLIPKDYKSGVSLQISDVDVRDYFLVSIRTCNATTDWKPLWSRALEFVDSFKSVVKQQHGVGGR
jgi:hypothetical protein